MARKDVRLILLVLASALLPTTSIAQRTAHSESAIKRFCAPHFTSGIAVRPKAVLESQAGKQILEAAFGAENVKAQLEPIESLIGLDPQLIEQVAIFTDAQLAQTAAGRDAPGSPAAKADAVEKIGAAFHNFHDKNGSFPAVDGHRRTSKGFLSWRVHLLPYLGHEALYKKFHLNEPWDSRHNKTLIDEMPDEFRSPGVRIDKGKTSIHVITGKGGLFDGRQARGIIDTTDGTSCTVLAVVAGTDKADIWTKPGGLDFDPARPAAAFGDVGDSVMILWADGSAMFVPTDINPQILTWMLQYADRHYLGAGAYQARPVARPGIVATSARKLTGTDRKRITEAICRDLMPSATTGRPSTMDRLVAQIRRFSTTRISGHRVLTIDYPLAASGRFGVAFPDDTTVVAAPLDHLQKMLDTKTPGKLGQHLASELQRKDAVGLVDSDAIQAFAAGLKPQLKATELRFALELSGPTLLQSRLSSPEPAQLREQLEQANRVFSGSSMMASALSSFINMADDRDGVQIQIQRPKNLLGALAMLRQAREAAQAKAERQAQIDRLSEIGYSFDNFMDVFARLPGYGRLSYKGRYGHELSWRVHLLPYLGEIKLYEQFRMEEPWDSDHNKKLIPMMPKYFQSRGVTKAGHTSIHVFAGKGSPFEKLADKNITRRDMQAEEDSTIAIVQAGPDTAAIWTKPTALMYEDDPISVLGNVAWPVRVATFAGDVFEVPKSITAAKLLEFIRHADGKQPDLTKFKQLNTKRELPQGIEDQYEDMLEAPGVLLPTPPSLPTPKPPSVPDKD